MTAGSTTGARVPTSTRLVFELPGSGNGAKPRSARNSPRPRPSPSARSQKVFQAVCYRAPPASADLATVATMTSDLHRPAATNKAAVRSNRRRVLHGQLREPSTCTTIESRHDREPRPPHARLCAAVAMLATWPPERLQRRCGDHGEQPAPRRLDGRRPTAVRRRRTPTCRPSRSTCGPTSMPSNRCGGCHHQGGQSPQFARYGRCEPGIPGRQYRGESARSPTSRRMVQKVGRRP